jgi:hypothetical protein
MPSSSELSNVPTEVRSSEVGHQLESEKHGYSYSYILALQVLLETKAIEDKYDRKEKKKFEGVEEHKLPFSVPIFR